MRVLLGKSDRTTVTELWVRADRKREVVLSRSVSISHYTLCLVLAQALTQSGIEGWGQQGKEGIK